nr:hypothetical protein [Acidobacteriota bacterium]
SQGRVRRETIKVYEVYPDRKAGFVRVQVSEDGVPLSVERIERERARAIKRLKEAEESDAKPSTPVRPAPNSAQAPVKRFQSVWITLERHKRGGMLNSYWPVRPTDFLMSHEFYAPRRAIIGGREAILLNFRPRAGYIYDKTNLPFKEGIEDYARVMSRLGGRVWIDASEKVILRLEAVPAAELNGASAAPDASAPIGFEFMRLPDAIWMPSRAWYNTRGRENFFWDTQINRVYKYADYKLFKVSADVERLNPVGPQQ